MTNEEIDVLDKEIRSVDFGFLKELSVAKLRKRQSIVQAQIPAAFQLMIKENTVNAHRGLLQLNAQNDAIMAELMRRN
jgi:hypothetical protein